MECCEDFVKSSEFMILKFGHKLIIKTKMCIRNEEVGMRVLDNRKILIINVSVMEVDLDRNGECKVKYWYRNIYIHTIKNWYVCCIYYKVKEIVCTFIFVKL